MSLTRHQVEMAMAKHRVKNKDIVRMSGRKHPTVSLVLSGHSRAREVEIAFAKAVGMKREDIFPIIPEPLGKAA